MTVALAQQSEVASKYTWHTAVTRASASDEQFKHLRNKICASDMRPEEKQVQLTEAALQSHNRWVQDLLSSAGLTSAPQSTALLRWKAANDGGWQEKLMLQFFAKPHHELTKSLVAQDDSRLHISIPTEDDSDGNSEREDYFMID